MFDPITEALIQSAPELPDLDLEHLPQRLTEAHVQIATLRIRLLEQGGEFDEELLSSLRRLHRLAYYYQSFVAILSDHDQREAAAYVAAAAHELLHQARQNVEGMESRPALSDDAVGSELASVLLYLIAG